MDNAKNIAKKLLYMVRPEKLPEGVQLNIGYIFHTEKIFDTEIFGRLLEFCKEYKKLTGKLPICAVMPGSNARVRAGIIKSGFTDDQYASRVRTLSQFASIAYHGHFWVNPALHENRDEEMRGTKFDKTSFEKQFQADLNWFQLNQIDHHGAYSAGWWFLNHQVQESLIAHHFKIDFSFSKTPWFYNPYAAKVMQENKILTGEPFQLHSGGGKITCIQNLIGCHHTPFPMDFVRNLKNLGLNNQKVVAGVVNAHDFDLDFEKTLKCLRFLSEIEKAVFCSLEDFLLINPSSKLRSFPLE